MLSSVLTLHPQEGHGLVRAQHAGSAKIQEFLGQLEVLWEELRRRHRRNAAFLQASEELGFRVWFIKYRSTGLPLQHTSRFKFKGKCMLMRDDSG